MIKVYEPLKKLSVRVIKSGGFHEDGTKSDIF